VSPIKAAKNQGKNRFEQRRHPRPLIVPAKVSKLNFPLVTPINAIMGANHTSMLVMLTSLDEVVAPCVIVPPKPPEKSIRIRRTLELQKAIAPAA